MRNYGTGRWEGGDPECEHRNAHRTQVAQTKHPNAAPSIINGPNLGGGKTCVKCGAVRADEQIGLEETLQEYVAKIVEVFREVRRVLKPTGTCWLNIGDSYNAGRDGGWPGGKAQWKDDRYLGRSGANVPGLKPKDRMLIPQRLAIALQDAGWWVRSEIVWSKPNCMPSSAEDRPTDSHEMIYFLSKAARYWSDFTAIREPARDWGTRSRANLRNGIDDPHLKHHGLKGVSKQAALGKRQYTGFNDRWDNREEPLLTRNIRSVWTIAPEPSNYDYCGRCDLIFIGPTRKDVLHRKVDGVKKKFCPKCNQDDGWVDHFAAYPHKLVERCILAGCPAQVCSVCGKPWVRIVESTGHVNKREPAHVPNSDPTKVDSTGWVPTKVATNLWQPTCKCGASVGAGVVLDPFLGSGTTALVARRLGRHFLGCDLSESYVRLANARLGQAYTLPLFVDV